MQSIYRILTEIQSKGENAAICTITETHGSTPLKAGAKMIVWNEGKITGTIGGGNLEKKVIEDAISVIKNKKALVFEHRLVQDHQMCCGGSVKLFIEPVMKLNKLYVFGAGHISKEIMRYTSTLDFHLSIIDERPEMFQNLNDTHVEIFKMSHKQFLPQMVFDEDAFIIICTHLHQYDREILAFCIQKPFAYLGMIGSKRKIAVTKRLFLSANLATEAELERVNMPMGFDIGGINPSEIALSITAKLVEVKNHRKHLSQEIDNVKLITKKVNAEFNYAETNSNSNRCW